VVASRFRETFLAAECLWRKVYIEIVFLIASLQGGIMKEVSRRDIKWNLEPPPKLLNANKSVSSGIDFRAFKLEPQGTFDYITPVLQVVLCCDHVRSRVGGKLRHGYRGMSEITLPGERIWGEWNGSGTLIGAYISPDFIEGSMGRRMQHLNLAYGTLTSPIVEHLLQSINADVAQGNPSGPMFIESAIVSLLHHISASPGKPPIVKGGLSARQLNTLKEVIDAELAGDLHLDRLARALGVSAGHLCRGFKASTGQSPYQYILLVRVERATQMIRAGNRSLEDIAERVGFADGSHMATVFLKTTGKPPSSFRNR
jgi:AraC-like DNA-binding protein